MAYSMTIWNHPSDGSERIYLNGSTRQSIYIKPRAGDGVAVWSSRANDTPHRFQTGDHYGKVRKDREAARAIAEGFGIELGKSTFADALLIAKRALVLDEL